MSVLRKFINLLGAFMALIILALPAKAGTESKTAIFGSGNPDGDWTMGYNTFNFTQGQVGLRAKVRTTGDMTNDGNGNYFMPTGPSSNPNRAAWNFEYSMDVNPYGMNAPGATNLTSYDWKLGIDTDPSQGQTFMWFNPFLFYPDMSLGNFGTANGAGVENFQYGNYTIAQNSSNKTFAPWGDNYFGDGTYDFVLQQLDKGTGEVTAHTEITVVVGQGGEAVPDTGQTLALMSACLAGLGFIRSRIGKQLSFAS